MEMAPAMSSAIPPRTTSLDSPSDDRPAVNAKGTVNPSERPMTLSVDMNDGGNAAVEGDSGKRLTHHGRCQD